MNDHEQSRKHFLPEIVDEQIDKLMRSQHQQKASMAPDEQLTGDLHALYQAHAGTRERVWQRVQERIASNDATSPLSAEDKQLARKQLYSFERHHAMEHEISTARPTPQRAPIQRLGLVAAVVFTALLVGSMAWIFTLAHRHSDGSDVASPGAAKQPQTASQQPSYSGIYVNASKSLLRVDIQTGKVIWHYDLPSILDSQIKSIDAAYITKYAYVGDTVYVLIGSLSSQYQGSIVALNAATGQKRWSQQPQTGKIHFGADMVVADSMIYITIQTVPGKDPAYAVASFATADGKPGVTFPVSSFPVSGNPYAITVLKNTLYVTTRDGLHAFDLSNHQQRWHTVLKPETAQEVLILTRPYILNGILYEAVETGTTVSRLAAFSADSGKQLWQSAQIQGQVSDLTISNGIMYFGSTIYQAGSVKGVLYAYDIQKGNPLWSVPTDSGVQWAPSVSNSVVYASAFVGMNQPENILALSASDGKQLWQHQITAGQMTTPYEQDGKVYVASGFVGAKLNGGTLYALNAKSGSQVWTLDLGNGPQDISVVP